MCWCDWRDGRCSSQPGSFSRLIAPGLVAVIISLACRLLLGPGAPRIRFCPLSRCPSNHARDHTARRRPSSHQRPPHPNARKPPTNGAVYSTHSSPHPTTRLPASSSNASHFPRASHSPCSTRPVMSPDRIVDKLTTDFAMASIALRAHGRAALDSIH